MTNNNSTDTSPEDTPVTRADLDLYTRVLHGRLDALTQTLRDLRRDLSRLQRRRRRER